MSRSSIARPVRHLALLLALCFAVACGEDGGSGQAVADPGERGPFPVGVRTLEFEDPARTDDQASRGTRFLVTEVWYPAVPAAREMAPDPVLGFLPAAFLDVIRGLIGDGIENQDALSGAVREAPLDARAGPFPLILLSHGNTSIRYQNFTLSEHLASHGFVVVAPDHIGNTLFNLRADGSLAIYNPLLLPISFVDRIIDMGFLADRFLELGANDPSGFFTGGIELGLGIGVAGHSFGGTTALAFSAVDERVAAQMPMTPAVIPVLTPAPSQPALMWTGLEDRTLANQSIEGSRSLFASSAAPRILAEFIDGGHFTFTDGCAYVASVFNGDGCGSGQRFADGSSFDFVPDEVALPVLNRSAAAFFRWTLRGEAAMLRELETPPDPAEVQYRFADLS